MVQELKAVGRETFVLLSNKANSTKKTVFYKKEEKSEVIFYYVTSGNLFWVDDVDKKLKNLKLLLFL